MATLVIKGTEGLGNRLLSLEFALRFAHSQKYAVEIDWSDPVYMLDEECFVKYIEVFGVPVRKVDRNNLGRCYPPALATHLEDDINSWSYKAPFLHKIPYSIAIWRKKKELVRKQNRQGYLHAPFFFRRTPSFTYKAIRYLLVRLRLAL